jgi:CheY-like chemotaxis protein
VVDRLRDLYSERDDHDECSTVELNAVLTGALEITEPKWRIQPMAEGRVIELVSDLQPIPAITANPAELREVVTNLVFNAVDAMPEGGTITVRTRTDADGVIMEFADTGTGMPDHVREQCLEPFFTTKGKQGTGLGLPMVAGIVKRHGGEMEIDSVAGVGTTIRIRLPFMEEGSAAPTVIEPPAPQPMKILLVDDDVAMRDLISTMLIRDGHEVHSARGGLDALEHLQKGEHFDVMLTDLAMPGMSGTQLAEHARHFHPRQQTILLTGFPMKGDEPLPGIHRVLQKPATANALRTALSSLDRPRFARAAA